MKLRKVIYGVTSICCEGTVLKAEIFSDGTVKLDKCYSGMTFSPEELEEIREFTYIAKNFDSELAKL